jgi:hypothetical protein
MTLAKKPKSTNGVTSFFGALFGAAAAVPN